MAKALLGHVRGPDQRMAAELRRLRQRVGDLEAQLARLKEEGDAASAAGRSASRSGLQGHRLGSFGDGAEPEFPQPPEHNNRGRTEFPAPPGPVRG